MLGNVQGLIPLDKPKGLTSRRCVDLVGQMVRVRKAGHAGSLDPLATGVLLILLGKATRLAEYLMRTEKEYLVTAQLGVKTDTADAEGALLEKREVPTLSREFLLDLLKSFVGEIQQIPPAYSAKKVAGIPAYSIARRGGQPRLAPITVTIFELALLSYQEPLLSLRVRCSHGTYIRTLCEDLGERLGCGAHVTDLRRTRVGFLRDQECVSLETLVESVTPLQFLRPLSEMVSFMPGVCVNDEEILALRQGKMVFLKERTLSGTGTGAEGVRALDDEGNLVAICRVQEDSGILKPEKVFVSGE